MAKKKSNVETFTSFLGDSTADTQATHESSTNAVQETHEQSTKAVLKRYDVRLSPEDWEGLKRAAAAEGTSASAIIRRLVKEYLRGV